jgi:hypothetical protein
MPSSARCTVLVLASLVFVAAPVFSADAPRGDGPHRFVVPALDGTPVVLQDPVNELAYSAWTYRSGRESDLAISVRDSSGVWGRPTFIGQFDGADQKDPVLALDAAGHVYLAFSSSDSGRISLAVLPLGAASWSSPVAVSPAGVRASAPALAIVGDSLVLAFRSGTRVHLLLLPKFVGGVGTLGIQDGPDPLGGASPPSGDDGKWSVPGTPPISGAL